MFNALLVRREGGVGDRHDAVCRTLHPARPRAHAAGGPGGHPVLPASATLQAQGDAGATEST